MSLSSSLKSLLTVCVLAAFVASTVEESYKCVQCDQQCDKEKTCDSSHGCFSKKSEFNMTVARKSSDPNGITCPACYNAQGATCQPSDLACKGEETKCLNFTGTVNDTILLFGMGCATETACNLKDVETINYIKIRTYCEGSSNGSPQLMSIISSILTALFLLKVLI
uniref:UPAR/Ly6 domain-containing protein n=1 Tax=Macaca fascicularis TaxID=9541 RepID=A0A7N9IED9_MACFA